MPTFTCPICHKEFHSLHRKGNKKAPTYCSHRCYQLARHLASQPESRPCKQCGKVFVPKYRHSQEYCSLQCLGESRKQGALRHCIYCGQAFYVQPSHPDKYCSRKCYEEEREKRITKICKRCGRVFKNYNNVAFCSKKCRDDRIFKGKIKPCKKCGKPFYVCQSHSENTHFCSPECRIGYNGFTSIELAVSEGLSALNIEHETQVKVGRFRIDIAIMHIKLAIECDGTYWHSLPENIARDKRKDQRLIKAGWHILRLPEEDIVSGLKGCIDKIICLLPDNR